MSSLDADKDGHISFEEFKAGFKVLVHRDVASMTVHLCVYYNRLTVLVR